MIYIYIYWEGESSHFHPFSFLLNCDFEYLPSQLKPMLFQGGPFVELLTIQGSKPLANWKVESTGSYMMSPLTASIAAGAGGGGGRSSGGRSSGGHHSKDSDGQLVERIYERTIKGSCHILQGAAKLSFPADDHHHHQSSASSLTTTTTKAKPKGTFVNVGQANHPPVISTHRRRPCLLLRYHRPHTFVSRTLCSKFSYRKAIRSPSILRMLGCVWGGGMDLWAGDTWNELTFGCRISDANHTRRRILISTSVKDVKCTPLHSVLPLIATNSAITTDNISFRRDTVRMRW